MMVVMSEHTGYKRGTLHIPGSYALKTLAERDMFLSKLKTTGFPLAN
jgi:hypothetical protein